MVERDRLEHGLLPWKRLSKPQEWAETECCLWKGPAQFFQGLSGMKMLPSVELRARKASALVKKVRAFRQQRVEEMLFQ